MGDLIARGMAYQNSKKTGPFAYNTDIGLRRWRAALAKVKAGTNQVINLCVLGDSITEGTGATTPWQTNSYVGRIRSALATKYGDVGTGFVPLFFPNNAPLWTFTGSWSDAAGYGAANKYKRSFTSGDIATLSFNGTGIGVAVAKGSPMGSFTASIDGGAATSFDSNSASFDPAFVYQITGLVDGTHTLTLTSTVTGGLAVYLLGAYPIKGTSGVRVNMVGRYGSVVSDSSSLYALNAEINMWSPALSVVSLTANDFNTQQPLDAYKANLQTIIDRALQFGDCLLLSTGLWQASGKSIAQSEYVKVMQDLALKNNVAYIDIFNRWSGNADYAKNTLGFIADSVHPNDYGHQDIATSVLNILLEER